jgi:hydroxymethylpyrimidine/phosphomethylpyrimidine kinase
MGCHPAAAVSAITVQDTRGVIDVLPLDARWIRGQLRCLLDDLPIAACKIGMLGSAEAAEAILDTVPVTIPLVLDPVLASGRGDPLASPATVSALRERIIPRAKLVTPNTIEARQLAQSPDLAECALTMTRWGCEYVLITGTHADSAEVVNTLYDRRGVVRSDVWERLPEEYHGSGCTLAAACAAGLAKKQSVAEAVDAAQRFTWESLKHGFRAGRGQLIPDRFFRAREEWAP